MKTQEPKPDQPDPADRDAADADHPEHDPTAQASDGYPIDFCLVSGAKLGSMGKPVTLEYEGRTLKFCCDSCISAFQESPDEYLKKLDEAAETLGKTQGGR